MSFTPEPGTPLRAYYAQTQPRIGAVLSRRSLGTLDAVTIGRYAMTARPTRATTTGGPHGRPGTPTSWRHRTCSPRSSSGVSAPRGQLQPDGTPHDGDMPLGDGDLGLRVMGAGEEMELVNPVVAGTEVVLETTLESVTAKQTRSGPCVFVTTITPSRHRRCRSQPQPAHRRAAQPLQES